MRHDDLCHAVEKNWIVAGIGIQHILRDPAGAVIVHAQIGEPLGMRHVHLGLVEDISRVQASLVERIEERHTVGLLIELDRAADREALARRMEAGDVEAEEVGKLRFRPEDEFAHL